MSLTQHNFVRFIIIALSLAITAACAHRPPTPEERLQAFIQDMIHELRLDASQEEKLELLSKALRSAMETAQAEGGPMLDRLLKALSDAHWDASLLTVLRDLAQLLADDVGPEVLTRMADFVMSLSANQRHQFSDWLNSLSE